MQALRLSWEVFVRDEVHRGPVSHSAMESAVSQSEVLGRFYNPNTTPKDKERVVVCLRGTGQELH